MSRKAKSNKIWMDRELANSSLFIGLKPTSIKVYIRFLCKRKMERLNYNSKPGKRKKEWFIKNNGEIEFTYAEAKALGICSSEAFNTAIDELVEKGLIDIERPGIGAAKIKTLYAVSDRWKKYGTDEYVKRKRIKRVSYRPPKGSFSNSKK